MPIFPITFIVSLLMLQPALAAITPADSGVLRMQTSLPKKANESLFSYTVEWQQDGAKLYRVTGLSFLNAAKVDSENAAGKISKKIVGSLKESMIRLDPSWRGITVSQPEDKPEVMIANKAGYALTSAVFRDYTNQSLSFDLPGKSFATADAQLAIDLVYAADVDYLDGFTSRKAQTASQGTIEIQIDTQKPVLIKTDGKTTRQIETEIVRELVSAVLSDNTLLPHVIGKDKRNNKPFDGSEVQLLHLAAKSIRIDISDPALGVLMKFKFKDDTSTATVKKPNFMATLLGLLGLAAVGYFLLQKKKKTA